MLGDRHQLRNWLERPAKIILVKSRDDHPLPGVSQLFAHGDQIQIEELGLVDADDAGFATQTKNGRGALDRRGLDRILIVGDHLVRAVARLDRRLEYLDSLPSNPRATQAADQFLRLPAEHGSADQLDPPPFVRPVEDEGFHTITQKEVISGDESALPLARR